MRHFAHHSEENYLKALYKLSSKQVKKVNNIALAKSLNLNPATVLEMVRKLAKRNDIEVKTDKSIELTEKGQKRALLTIRKHRIWEVFLVEKLGYKWSEVHDLAEQLEHIESDDLINRLEVFLEFPAFDPHGDPIPDKKGKIKYTNAIPLSDGQIGKTYEIIRLAETDDQFLKLLNKLHIQLSTKVKLIEQNSFDNSLLVSI
ncbi:MAG TPA: metal-dependent transcriptional regulator, partial [Flavisolibacter sp.]|nr:metal-dependent transcriptional regulator [Flavisolibacter sp.]